MLTYSLLTVFLFIIPLLLLYFYSSVGDYIRMVRTIRKLPTPHERIPLLGHLIPLFCSPVEGVFNYFRKWNIQSPVFYTQLTFIFFVNVSDPDDIEAILSTTKHNSKGSIYKYLQLWLGEGLLTSKGAKWQTRRKILTPAFHFSILQQFVKVFNKEADRLVQFVKQNYLNREVALERIVESFTLQTINETSMGIQLDTQTEEGEKYKNSLAEMSFIIFERFIRPWCYFNNLYYTLLSLGSKEKNVVAQMHQFTGNVIDAREKHFQPFQIPNEIDENHYFGKRKKLAMLDILLNAKVNQGIIDDQGIKDEVNTFVFEALDTTARHMVYLLMLLACHEDIQEQVYQETLQIIGSDTSKQPSYNELQQLSLMERCIKETLRLYPSVPMISRTIDEDVKTKYGIIPKGSEVLIHIYDVHRNATVWTDPDKFNPDRFLPENSRGRHPFAYIPFSAGPRNCIGQKFALLEIKSALVGILRNFKLQPVDTPENIVFVQELLLRTKENIRVKFVLRQ